MGLTTDKNTPCLNAIRPDGQQECYLVLSDEEKAKGFVRPVRQTYRHVTCRRDTTMGLAIAETYARNPAFYGGTFCVGCVQHFPLVDANGVRQFVWVNEKGDAEIDEYGQAQFVGD